MNNEHPIYILNEYLKKDLKLSAKKSFNIIYFLQETISRLDNADLIFSDTIEKCTKCKELFDTNSEGLIDSESGYAKFYCGYCDNLIK